MSRTDNLITPMHYVTITNSHEEQCLENEQSAQFLVKIHLQNLDMNRDQSLTDATS